MYFYFDLIRTKAVRGNVPQKKCLAYDVLPTCIYYGNICKLVRVNLKEVGCTMEKALGTLAVWGGVVGLCYVLGQLGILTGFGACLLVLGAFLLTAGIWNM